MSERLNRRKTIYFLLGLSLFAFFAVKITRNQSIDSKTVMGEYTVEENVQTDSDDSSTVQAMFFEVDDELNPVKEIYPSVVLSAESNVGDCQKADIVYSSSSVCYSSSANFSEDLTQEGSVEVGELISTGDLEIRLVDIEVPPLYSGSPTMDSSVRQVYKDNNGDYHWTLRPSGEMIEEEVVKSDTYPGDTYTEGLLDEARASQTTAYGIEYSIEVEGDAEGGGDSELTISQYYENDTGNCEDSCRNEDNPTPEKYLINSKVLAKSKQYPGYYDSIAEETDGEEIEECDSDTQFYNMDIAENRLIACTPTLEEVVVSFFKRIASLFQAESCSEEDENNGSCISTADIIIVMESPWGTAKDCAENGQCVNEFNDLRTGDFEYPKEDDSGDVYVLTDCSVYIEGLSTQSVKCAWDISYIAEELEFQSNDNIPGEDYPSKSDYLDFHITESENRTDTPLSM